MVSTPVLKGLGDSIPTSLYVSLRHLDQIFKQREEESRKEGRKRTPENRIIKIHRRHISSWIKLRHILWPGHHTTGACAWASSAGAGSGTRLLEGGHVIRHSVSSSASSLQYQSGAKLKEENLPLELPLPHLPSILIHALLLHLRHSQRRTLMRIQRLTLWPHLLLQTS